MNKVKNSIRMVELSLPPQTPPEAQADGSVKIHVLARGMKSCLDYYPEYEDFTGVVLPDAVVVDVEHDNRRPIGKAYNWQLTEYGLECDAEIYPDMPSEEKPEGSRICKMLERGIPLQASIMYDWDSWDDVEEVKPTATAEVNGMTISGPCVIYRRWNLRGLAICLHGADNTTNVVKLSYEQRKERQMDLLKLRSEEPPKEVDQPEPIEEPTEGEPAKTEGSDLESRVAALEESVAELRKKMADEQPVPIENDAEPTETPDKTEEKTLTAVVKTLSLMAETMDKLVQVCSGGEQMPVGMPKKEHNPAEGSLRFSSMGLVSSKIKEVLK